MDVDVERSIGPDDHAKLGSEATRPDYAAVRDGRLGLADVVRGLDRTALAALTDDLYDEILGIVGAATDAEVAFAPHDPAATAGDGAGWTIAQVVAHLTATCEEAAALASSLARGIVPEGRSRFEAPADGLQTAARVRRRLAESRRVCHAFLATWPTPPHLNLTITLVPRFGPLDARAQFVLGLVHGDWHLDQLRETLRQSRLPAAA